jgi:tetratricopeptide (TPR) repeat protein
MSRGKAGDGEGGAADAEGAPTVDDTGAHRRIRVRSLLEEGDAPAPAPAAAPALSESRADRPLWTTRNVRAGRRRDDGPRALAPGDLVAGRYRIERFIAAGGMGEVYAALDRELGERIALKTVHPERAAEHRVVERFRREIGLARRVTHPNVCRTFDVGFHERRPGEPPLIFLTMELVDGRTLAGRIADGGALPIADACAIARMVAEALAAAHEAGVVHGDVKSNNVLLREPRRGESGRTRVVVTDFGLALTATSEDGAVDGEGAIGTPEYMAPEQLEGKLPTAASDVYAAGVMLYEMLTGRLPFPDIDAPGGLGMRLQEEPPSPRAARAEIPAGLDALVRRAMARRPEERFADGAALAAALAEVGAALEGPRSRPMAPVAPLGTRVAIAIAAVVVVALIGGLAGLALQRSRAPSPSSSRASAPSAATTENAASPTAAGAAAPATPARVRRHLAVLAPTNASGRPDEAWLGGALAEMLATELGASDDLRVIPPGDVARARAELRLRDGSGPLEPDVRARLARRLGVDLVVTGAYVFAPGGKRGDRTVRLDLRVVDTTRGEVVAVAAGTGTAAQLFELVSAAGAELRGRLGVRVTHPEEARSARVAVPTDPRAARLYVEGLARLRASDARAAERLFTEAVAIEPNSPTIRSALSQAWERLGYDARAVEEARRAFELAGSLGRLDRLTIEAHYRRVNREWDKAVALHRAVVSLFPDDLDAAIALISTETAAGRTKDADDTVARLRALPPPLSDDPRIDLSEAMVCYSRADYPCQQRRSAEAARKAGAIGAPSLVAEARLLEAQALRYLGEIDRATAAAAEAERIGGAESNSDVQARAIHSAASIALARGDSAAGRRLYERALALYRAVGDLRGEASVLSALVNVDTDAAPARIIARYEEVLRLNRLIGDRRGEAVQLNNIGTAHQGSGHLDEARRAYEDAAGLLDAIELKSMEASVLANLGTILVDMGRVAAARETLDRALSMVEPTKSSGDIAWVRYEAGQIALIEGRLAEARRMFTGAAGEYDRGGSPSEAAIARASLAEVVLAEGRAADALVEARAAAEATTQADGTLDYGLASSARAWEVVARAALAAGSVDEAQTAIERAARELPKQADPDYRTAVAIARARVDAARGARDAAHRALRSVVTQARAGGYVAHELAARLALVESGLDRADASPLERDAGARGFALVAQRARAAQGRDASSASRSPR